MVLLTAEIPEGNAFLTGMSPGWYAFFVELRCHAKQRASSGTPRSPKASTLVAGHDPLHADRRTGDRRDPALADRAAVGKGAASMVTEATHTVRAAVPGCEILVPGDCAQV